MKPITHPGSPGGYHGNSNPSSVAPTTSSQVATLKMGYGLQTLQNRISQTVSMPAVKNQYCRPIGDNDLQVNNLTVALRAIVDAGLNPSDFLRISLIGNAVSKNSYIYYSTFQIFLAETEVDAPMLGGTSSLDSDRRVILESLFNGTPFEAIPITKEIALKPISFDTTDSSCLRHASFKVNILKHVKKWVAHQSKEPSDLLLIVIVNSPPETTVDLDTIMNVDLRLQGNLRQFKLI